VAAQVADADKATQAPCSEAREAKCVYDALQNEDYTAALKALTTCSSAMQLLWLKPAHINKWREKAVEAQVAAARKPGSKVTILTAAAVVDAACLGAQRVELYASGLFLPCDWPDPLQVGGSLAGRV
jgi:hypothetical protein